MTGKQLRHVLSATTLAFACIAQGVQADIQNPVWESPVAGTVSGIQTFRGHVSSTTTGVEVTVRLLIPSVSASFSLQIPWGAERADVAASGSDRFSGFGSSLNVGDLPPGGPVEMILEMREGGGTGACTPPTCVRESRSFTVVKPGARTGERAQFSFALDFAAFADLANPAIDPIPAAARPSNVATDLATILDDGGPDIILAPVTIQDTATGGGGLRTATLRQRWVRNTQSLEIIAAATSDNTRFPAVREILRLKCATTGCHIGGGTALPGSMLLDTSTNAFFHTVAVRSLESPQTLRITPGDTTNSYLYQKIIAGGTIAPGTVRMPWGCPDTTPCLSTSEIDTIRDWIVNGAPPPSP